MVHGGDGVRVSHSHTQTTTEEPGRVDPPPDRLPRLFGNRHRHGFGHRFRRDRGEDTTPRWRFLTNSNDSVRHGRGHHSNTIVTRIHDNSDNDNNNDDFHNCGKCCWWFVSCICQVVCCWCCFLFSWNRNVASDNDLDDRQDATEPLLPEHANSRRVNPSRQRRRRRRRSSRYAGACWTWLAVVASIVAGMMIMQQSSLTARNSGEKSLSNSAHWIMNKGESRQFGMTAWNSYVTVTASTSAHAQAPFATKQRLTRFIDSTDTSSGISIYQIKPSSTSYWSPSASCPSLTGPPVRVEDYFSVQLARGDFQYDYFYLNAGSLIQADITQTFGATNIYLLQGQELLDRLLQNDDDLFWTDHVLRQAYIQGGRGAPADAKVSHVAVTNDVYILLYDNALPSVGQFSVSLTVTMTTYNLQGLRPVCSIAAGANLLQSNVTSERRLYETVFNNSIQGDSDQSQNRTLDDAVSNLHACWIPGGAQTQKSCIIIVAGPATTSVNNVDTVVVVDITGYRKWLSIIFLSLSPLILVIALSTFCALCAWFLQACCCCCCGRRRQRHRPEEEGVVGADDHHDQEEQQQLVPPPAVSPDFRDSETAGRNEADANVLSPSAPIAEAEVIGVFPLHNEHHDDNSINNSAFGKSNDVNMVPVPAPYKK